WFLLPLALIGFALIAQSASGSHLPGNPAGEGSESPNSPRVPLDTPTSTPTPDPCAPVWSVIPSPNVGGLPYGAAAVSATDVWTVGYYDNTGSGLGRTLVEHWDGTSWAVVPSPNLGTGSYLYGVAAVSANDVWAVGYSYNPNRTLVEHWNGT